MSTSQKLSGKGTVTFVEDTPTLTMSTGFDAYNYVTLDCSLEEDEDGYGVRLSTDAANPTAFYIVVPPSANNFGFNVSIQFTNNYEITGYMSKKATASAANKIERSKYTSMPAFSAAIVTGEYVENEFAYGVGMTIGSSPAVTWAPVNCGYNATGFKYGKLYQWGRKDGQGFNADHPATIISQEAIAYGGVPAANTFYKSYSSSGFQWMKRDASSNNAFDDTADWMDLKGATSPHKDNPGIGNPCPEGWRVPTLNELTALKGGNNSPSLVTVDGLKGFWFNGTSSPAGTGIFLPAAGRRLSSSDDEFDREEYIYYWSSKPSGSSASYLQAIHWNACIIAGDRGNAMSVRCVKE